MIAACINRKFVTLWLHAVLLIFSLPLQAKTDAPLYQEPDELVDYIQALCMNIEEKGRMVNKLTEAELADLPLGLAREVGGVTIVIAVDSAHYTKRGWFFSAYAAITLPGSTRPIAFRAINIAFNDGGLARSSLMKLLLANNQRLAVNEKVALELPADGRNYVEFNCDGFRSVNLKGEFVFAHDFLEPDRMAAPSATEVRATFEVNVSDVNNILASVTITPFRIPGLHDLAFRVTQATVDYSDLVNPPGFSMPASYQQSYGENISLWRGFFLKDVNIRYQGLGIDSTRAPVIGAHNLIIDDQGVTGLFAADNLAAFRDISLSGWPLTVDHLQLSLLFNKVNGGGMGGALTVPFLGDEPIPFWAEAEQGAQDVNWRFLVGTPKDKLFTTSFADIRLRAGSSIVIEKRDGTFIPSAILHGSLSVNRDMLSVKDVDFQNVVLTASKPFITGGEFSMVTSQQAKGVGFPIHIDSIKLKIFQGQIGIGFGVTLNFMNSDDKSFSASTFIEVLAKIVEEDMPARELAAGEQSNLPEKRQRWTLDKIRVNMVTLDCETQAFRLKGSLTVFDDDPVYGDGFHGSLSFAIDPILSKGVKVNAYFGSKEDYRYWHVDAYVPIGFFTLLPPAPLFLTGIMGGASYHMVRQQNFTMDFSKLNVPAKDTNPNDALVYIPNAETGLAFMAGITLAVVQEKIVNGDIKLEIAFNAHGGLRYIQFDGSAFILSALADRDRSSAGSVPKAPVYVNMSMIFDNENDLFHASCKTYINLFGILTGVGPNGLVGEVVMHFDRKDWYIYVGRPSEMFGLQILGLVSIKTYFMTGTKIEDLPLPPIEVQRVFEGIDLRLVRDEASTKRGGGFAAGFHFRIGFDSGTKLTPFYVAVAVGAGADMMMRNYGNAHCEGQSGRIGINGWYALGQAYVFLEGRVGIRVRKKTFDILSLGAAALLQATLPNPAWMRGMLGGYYSILGGLVKGKFNLTLVIGEQCEIVSPGAGLEDIKIIADMKPEEAAGESSVFSAPQVSFNTAIDTEFSMVDIRNNTNTYRIRLQEFVVRKDGQVLAAQLQWNDTKDVAILHTAEILPPKSTLTATAKITWERKSDGGQWEVMTDDEGATYVETKESPFTTGEAPDFIPEENVAYSYPVKNQYNLYLNESGQGYVKLNQGQAYLFEPVSADGTAWEFIARYKNKKSGVLTDVPLLYDVAKANASFELPSQLPREGVFTLNFVRRPIQAGAIDQNLKRSEVTTVGSEGNETTVTSNTLEGSIAQNIEKDIYTSAFRTSQFGKFEEKIADFDNGNDIYDVAVGMTAVIGKRSALRETFDKFELNGGNTETQAPLILLTATEDTPWMKQTVSPLLYDVYPVSSDVKITWRDTKDLGLKPLKGVSLRNDAGNYVLTDANLNAGMAPAKGGTVMLGYFVSYYTWWDYSDMADKAAAILANDANAPEPVKRLLAGKYEDLRKGYNYPIDITYTLPGATQPNFKKRVTIKY